MSLVLIGNLTHPSPGEQHAVKYLLCSEELKRILIHTVAGRNPHCTFKTVIFFLTTLMVWHP